MPRSNRSSPNHVVTAADDDHDELSPSPCPVSSPWPQAATTAHSTRTLRSHRTRAQNKPQAQVKAAATPTQPAASTKRPKPPRPTPRRANKHASESTNPALVTQNRRSKRPRTPAPPEQHSEDGEGKLESERKDEEPRPLSRHRSRSRSLSIIPTVDMPPLTYPAPDDCAVRALGLPQSSRPGAATLSLNRDHLIRMREGHFARARPTRKKDKNRDWKNLTISEAAWARLEEIGCVTKGRAWTAQEGYDDDGNPVKPDLPYVILTKLVIASSPRKMLTLNQIYQAMEERWPYFKKLGQTFRNSIRHNLSMNPAFINVERPLSEGGLGTGKGGYWKVSENTTTSHRGRAKKPRLELPTDGSMSVDLHHTPHPPTRNEQTMETYPPRPLVHMQPSFGSYPVYTHRPQVAYPPLTHADRSAVYQKPTSHHQEYRDHDTAFDLNGGHHDVLLSPARAIAEPSSYRMSSPDLTHRTSSLDMSPESSIIPRLSQGHPREESRLAHSAYHPLSPPSLDSSSFYATQSPPDHRITTPPSDGLMQLANAAAETDHAKTQAILAPLGTRGANYSSIRHRLPSVRTLLNSPLDRSLPFLSSSRSICG